MNKYLFSLLIVMFVGLSIKAQKAVDIEVVIDNYEQDTLILAYYLGENQYVKDSVTRSGENFLIQADSLFDSGLYSLILLPDHQVIQLILDQDQKFKVSTDVSKQDMDFEFKGSKENEIYYDYVAYINEKKPLLDSLQSLRQSIEEGDEKSQEQLTKQVETMDKMVEEEIERISAKYPKSFASKIIQGTRNVHVPEMNGKDAKETNLMRFNYYRKHYFDYIDLSDERLLRTPFLFGKIDYFVDKLTFKHPDSITNAVNHVLGHFDDQGELFQYYLVHYVNKFASAKIVGMDEVFVNLVDQYYAKGKAYWADEENTKKIIENANKMKPTLIGKQVPKLLLQDSLGAKIDVDSIDAEYTVLYFYKFDCGHCKKSTPKVVDFYERYKEKGVKVVTICTKFTKDVPGCWKYLKTIPGSGQLLNLCDPYHKTKMMSVFNLNTTPRILVLDENKKIISKNIGAEQLPEVLDHHIKLKKRQLDDQKN